MKFLGRGPPQQRCDRLTWGRTTIEHRDDLFANGEVHACLLGQGQYRTSGPDTLGD